MTIYIERFHHGEWHRQEETAPHLAAANAWNIRCCANSLDQTRFIVEPSDPGARRPHFTSTQLVDVPASLFFKTQGYARLVEVTIERWEDFAHVVLLSEAGDVYQVDTRHGETEEANAAHYLTRGYTDDRCCLA